MDADDLFSPWFVVGAHMIGRFRRLLERRAVCPWPAPKSLHGRLFAAGCVSGLAVGGFAGSIKAIEWASKEWQDRKPMAEARVESAVRKLRQTLQFTKVPNPAFNDRGYEEWHDRRHVVRGMAWSVFALWFASASRVALRHSRYMTTFCSQGSYTSLSVAAATVAALSVVQAGNRFYAAYLKRIHRKDPKLARILYEANHVSFYGWL